MDLEKKIDWKFLFAALFLSIPMIAFLKEYRFENTERYSTKLYLKYDLWLMDFVYWYDT